MRHTKAVVTVIALAVVFVLAGCAALAMRHDIHTHAKPWTHLGFKNDPDAFQFAIVSDRNGGHRPGIFTDAVSKLNLLQPEFVMSVGDLIQGYTEDTAELAGQRAEFDGIVHGLDAPFFYVPGNHDITNPLMAEDWERRYGRRYYSFVYRDVLFLCLDTQGGPIEEPGRAKYGGLGLTQAAWAVAEIRKHSNVRWTFIFMHKPLWVYEEEIKPGAVPGYTRWAEVKDSLGERSHTVFAGHLHTYTKYLRDGHPHIILATTGGRSDLKGPMSGQFDHIVWVTMADNGPRMANLMLDGIYDENVYTEEHKAALRDIRFNVTDAQTLQKTFAFVSRARNPHEKEMHIKLTWLGLSDGAWAVTPAMAEATVAPGKTKELQFIARRGKDMFPLPQCLTEVSVGGKTLTTFTEPVPVDVEAYLAANRPTTVAPPAAQPPLIDGKLADATWQRSSDATAFRTIRGFAKPSVDTGAWMAYDANHLYIAVRCDEPNMDKLKAEAEKRDGAVWDDDAIEILFDTNRDGKAYHQFIVNVAEVVYDALSGDSADYTADLACAVSKDADGWSLEVAIRGRTSA